MRTVERNRIVSLLIALCMVFGVFIHPISVEAAQNAEEQTITIFHTNDLHGTMITSSSAIGMDKIAAYKNSVEDSILVDAGDATQGNSFATLTKGADVITLMNMAGYDVMAAGNHEFDYGLDQLIKNAQSANFPILSANSVKNGNPVLQNNPYSNNSKTNNGAWYIKEVNGVKVGFFAITTPETATKSNPDGIVGVTFGANMESIVSTANQQIDTLKAEGANVIVGIMHLGIDPSSEITSEVVATELSDSGLNLIIDGHSHSKFDKEVGGIFIAQTGNGAANLGKVEITMSGTAVTDINGVLIAASAASVTPVAEITSKANQLLAEQKILLSPIVGNSTSTFWGGTINGLNEARAYETNLGSLIADSMKDAAEAAVAGTAYASYPVVALQNGGGVRAIVKAGDITRGDVINVLPFGNSLAYKLVTPEVLYKAFENGVGKITAQDPVTGKFTGLDGRFPQISGMRFEFDPTKTATTYDTDNNPVTYGNRVTKIVLLNEDGTDGITLDRDDNLTEIILASNDFEIAGGDGYIMLKGLVSVGEGKVLDEVFGDYITRLTANGGGTFSYPITKNRIKTVGAYIPTPYSASITIKDSNGELLANRTVVYTIDGVRTNGDTNNNGILTISNLADGPHTIGFVSGNAVLVNNYSGAGMTTQVAVVTSAYTAAMVIDSPSQNDLVSNEVEVSGWVLATDGIGNVVESIEVYVNSKLAAQQPKISRFSRVDVKDAISAVNPSYQQECYDNCGFSFTLDTSSLALADGEKYEIEVVCKDSHGTIITSQAVQLVNSTSVVSMPPLMCIDDPTPNKLVFNTLDISGWVLFTRDGINDGISKIQVVVGGNEYPTERFERASDINQQVIPGYTDYTNAGFSAHIDISSLPEGINNVQIVVYDEFSQVKQIKSISINKKTVTVSNPFVSVIDTPAGNISKNATSVDITGWVLFDMDGVVDDVKVFSVDASSKQETLLGTTQRYYRDDVKKAVGGYSDAAYEVCGFKLLNVDITNSSANDTLTFKVKYFVGDILINEQILSVSKANEAAEFIPSSVLVPAA